MNIPTAEKRFFEFRFPHLSTTLRLVVQGENATVYASRNTFSTHRKEMFVRELIAEGFIPESSPCTFGEEFEKPLNGVRWVLDLGWATREISSEAGAKRLASRLFISSTLLVVVFFGLVLGGSYCSNSATSAHQTALIHGSQFARR